MAPRLLATPRPQRTARGRKTTLSIAPATTPDVHVSSHPSPLRHHDLSAALSSASPRRLSSDSRTRSFGAEDGDDEEEEDGGGELNVGMLRWGWTMLGCSTLCFVLGVWSIAVGPFIDTKGVFMLDAMAKDTHYKYLLVFLVPVTLYAVIINWWGLKIFRHA